MPLAIKLLMNWLLLIHLLSLAHTDHNLKDGHTFAYQNWDCIVSVPLDERETLYMAHCEAYSGDGELVGMMDVETDHDVNLTRWEACFYYRHRLDPWLCENGNGQGN